MQRSQRRDRPTERPATALGARASRLQSRPLSPPLTIQVPSVQLHHRALALTTVGTTTALWLWVQRRPLPPQLRLATDLLLVGAWAQVTLRRRGVALLLAVASAVVVALALA